MDFVVDFNTWTFKDNTFSEERGRSMLMNETGYMCCLGHCTLQMLPEAEVKYACFPEQVNTGSAEYRSIFLNDTNNTSSVTQNSELSRHAIYINDDLEIPYRTKIMFLQLLFEIYGHSISFINVPKLPL